MLPKTLNLISCAVLTAAIVALSSAAEAATCPDLTDPKAPLFPLMEKSAQDGGLPAITQAVDLARAGHRAAAINLLLDVHDLPIDERIMTLSPPVKPGYVQAVSSAGLYAYVLNGCQTAQRTLLP